MDVGRKVPFLARHSKGQYYFRRPVPPDLQPILKKKNWTRWYSTKNFAEAQALAIRDAVECEKEFEFARYLPGVEDLLLNATVTLFLEGDGIQPAGPFPNHKEMEEAFLEYFRSKRTDCTAEDIQRATKAFHREYQKKLERNYINARLGEPDPRIRKMLESEKTSLESGGNRSPADAKQSNNTEPTFSQIATLYLEDKNPPITTRQEVDRAVKLLVDWLGRDCNPTEITKDEFRDFVAALRNMPRRLPEAERKLGMRVLIKQYESEKTERLAPATVGKLSGMIQAVLNWAVDNDKLSANHLAKIRVSRTETNDPHRARFPFTDGELAILLNPNNFDQCPVSDQWVWKLALYHGLRLEEIGQLRVADIQRNSGFDVIRVAITEDAQDLKTFSSRRMVPIHEKVREEFLAYVATVRGDRVFPFELDKKGKFTTKVSKRLNYYIRTVCKIQNQFHATRHNFKRICREVGIEEDVHDAFTGHTNGSVGRRYGTDGQYRGMFSLRKLKEEIDKIRYPGD